MTGSPTSIGCSSIPTGASRFARSMPAIDTRCRCLGPRSSTTRSSPSPTGSCTRRCCASNATAGRSRARLSRTPSARFSRASRCIDHLEAAVESAARHRPDLADTFAQLFVVLSDAEHPAAIRFQQTSGMVMAKGVEDTAFYRYSRLGSLNEVGADPSQFSISVEEFHRRQQRRQATYPASLVTLTTHDTKRGEDVRARLHALAEVPAEWSTLLDLLDERCAIGDPPLEQLLWQTVIGAWPLSRERLHAYAEKAAREAGSSTDWAAPCEVFEHTMHAMLDRVFDDEVVSTAIESFVRDIAPAGWSNALSATLLQIAGPGVPDIYQGSELWETSLVDPDNRRSVDFARRATSLDALDTGVLPPIDKSGAAKLVVTSRALRLRRDHAELFHRYAPVDVFGTAVAHVVAFDRGEVIGLATRLPIGLERSGGWADTSVHVATRPMIDVITGRTFGGGPLALADLLDIYPVALLAPEEEVRA
jgi:(1->4)-alpha-D-glucan 1-alpha-D-glucosylmutase